MPIIWTHFFQFLEAIYGTNFSQRTEKVLLDVLMCNIADYYMAGYASGQDEANPVFLLATRAGKMGLS